MTKIIFFGDNDTTGDAVKVLDAIKKEQNVDQYVFLGDGPYASSGTKWVGMMKPFFPDTSKLVCVQGNHDHEESESAKTEADIEAWIPSLKDTPEAGGDQSWENTKWLTAKQVGDVYLISMNSQDLDIEFKRNQYNWVKKQLGVAMGLQKSGKVTWIINAVHKPWFTLKSSHSPYTAVREIYSDLFKGVVDMNFHGHNHNDQAWFPMIAVKTSGNAAGQPLYTLAADKKTLDFTKAERGWTTNICGHSGHEHNLFKENATANKNVMWANDKIFSYVVLETNPQTKIANVKWKDVSNKVLFEYNITKAGMSATPPPPPPPPPTTDPNAPTVPPPGAGYRWDPTQKKWIPKLEDPAFLNKPTGTPPPPQQQVTTPPPPPPPPPKVEGLGTVIWTSKGIWDNGKDRTFTSTDPDDPNSQMRAGENRSCHVDGKGTAYFSGARGRMYWYATNYDFIMQFDMIWNDTIENIGLRGRSRHNEGGGCDTAFGGYGANYHKAEMDFKSEDSHSAGGGVSSKNFPYPKPFEAGKKYGIKFQLKDDPKPKMKFWIDYKDGKGFIQISEYVDENPLPCRINRKSFEEISYLWLRTNNESGMPKDYAVSNVVILETSGIKQSNNKGKDYAGGSGE